MVSRGNTSHSALEYATPEHASGSAEMLNRALLPWPPVGYGLQFQTPGETRLALGIVTGLLNRGARTVQARFPCPVAAGVNRLNNAIRA